MRLSSFDVSPGGSDRRWICGGGALRFSGIFGGSKFESAVAISDEVSPDGCGSGADALDSESSLLIGIGGGFGRSCTGGRSNVGGLTARGGGKRDSSLFSDSELSSPFCRGKSLRGAGIGRASETGCGVSRRTSGLSSRSIGLRGGGESSRGVSLMRSEGARTGSRSYEGSFDRARGRSEDRASFFARMSTARGVSPFVRTLSRFLTSLFFDFDFDRGAPGGGESTTRGTTRGNPVVESPSDWLPSPLKSPARVGSESSGADDTFGIAANS